MSNPLYAIAAQKHIEDHRTGEYDFTADTPKNKNNYTLGFCRGITYATEMYSKQIELLQQQVSELKKMIP